MTFEAPWRLLLLLAVAALAVLYVVLQRRRRKYAVRFTSLPLLDKVAPERPAWRRHVPAGLFLVMLVALVTGFARPETDVQVPRERATVIVAVDVSRSMLAEDVEPDRLEAARIAAAGFVESLPEQFNVGLVAFAGEANVVVPPGRDREAVLQRLSDIDPEDVVRQGTAIGDAVAASLTAVSTLDAAAEQDPPPARVVLLSDGANTAGQDPAQAAESAAAAGLPVDSILFGTGEGTIVQGGELQAVPVDGQTLQDVAERTGGSYHEAASAGELSDVYTDIGSSVGYETERQDVSARFAGLALLLGFAAAAGSLIWFSRLP